MPDQNQTPAERALREFDTHTGTPLVKMEAALREAGRCLPDSGERAVEALMEPIGRYHARGLAEDDERSIGHASALVSLVNGASSSSDGGEREALRDEIRELRAQLACVPSDMAKLAADRAAAPSSPPAGGEAPTEARANVAPEEPNSPSALRSAPAQIPAGGEGDDELLTAHDARLLLDALEYRHGDVIADSELHAAVGRLHFLAGQPRPPVSSVEEGRAELADRAETFLLHDEACASFDESGPGACDCIAHRIRAALAPLSRESSWMAMGPTIGPTLHDSAEAAKRAVERWEEQGHSGPFEIFENERFVTRWSRADGSAGAREGRDAPARERIRTAHPEAERVARAFHTHYEALADSFGYTTREESRRQWGEVPDQNRRLMVAVVDELLRLGVIDVPVRGETDAR